MKFLFSKSCLLRKPHCLLVNVSYQSLNRSPSSWTNVVLNIPQISPLRYDHGVIVAALLTYRYWKVANIKCEN